MSAASEPLNFFIIVIYDLWPTYSFLLAPLKMVALTTSRIYLVDITHIDKNVIKLAKNSNFCANWLVVKHRKGRSKL